MIRPPSNTRCAQTAFNYLYIHNFSVHLEITYLVCKMFDLLSANAFCERSFLTCVVMFVII